ncbi:queuine tRNA-ribosyltransferase [Plasmodium gonderi]|uniref:Queuine tRNA-ribosyltransferase n=1 Tax=Plasmodium gonderi TaxID=77519 RepID=A0A1Y1JGW8_PLAGO|nr:queuine tRNA-ribosyltransferase [Plasmodium gonderi]GAW79314.1 queuine tRNA-ribosyltransferase [Plasmodium gonderi]
MVTTENTHNSIKSYKEPLPFDFITNEEYRKYDKFVNFCEMNFSYIDMEDVNIQIRKLKSGDKLGNSYLSNVISSSSDEENENCDEHSLDLEKDHSSQLKKKGIYRKNLKLINIKKNKRARINLIVIKKKYIEEMENKMNTVNKNDENIQQKKNTVIISPIFMPVGTKSCIKGLVQEEVKNLCKYIILSNTYHLSNIYDISTFQRNKDINNFIRFPNSMLTDSGGFQMVSLSKRITILEEGILFDNIYDNTVIRKNIHTVCIKEVEKANGTHQSNATENDANTSCQEILLTPETSIKLQNEIGSDIIMALDDVRSATETDVTKIEEATHRTNRWLERCIKSHSRKYEQSLFGIIQGGLHINLRNESMEFILKQKLNGYAIGGLCGGEKKKNFINIVHHCSNEKNKKWNYLPINKCRYIMGIGYLMDILFCSLLGYDMYDCVYASRTARFNTALSYDGTLKLKQAKYLYDFSPLVKNCHCYVCTKFSKSALHLLISKKNPIANILLTIHNIYFTLHFCYLLRVSIFSNKIDQFATTFLYNNFVIGSRNGNYKVPDNDKVSDSDEVPDNGKVSESDEVPDNDKDAIGRGGRSPHAETKNENIIPNEDSLSNGTNQTQMKNIQDEPIDDAHKIQLANCKLTNDDETCTNDHTQPRQNSPTCNTLTDCQKEEMIKELRDKLPYWALEALEYAEIQLML